MACYFGGSSVAPLAKTGSPRDVTRKVVWHRLRVEEVDLMRSFLRRVRGALGIGLTWGVAWGAIFATIGLIAWLIDPDIIGPGEGAGVIIGTGAVLGLVSGAVFSGLLVFAERGRELRELSMGRVALWGAIATAVFPLLTSADNSMLFFLCPIGAGLAAGSVSVAKRALIRDPHDESTLDTNSTERLSP